MGKRSKVARRSDAALGRHHGQYVPVEQLEQTLNNLRSDSRVALGKGSCAEQEHRPHHFVRDRRPDACGVGADQVVLKGLAFFFPDVG